MFLEEIVEETISFNKKINWDSSLKNLSIVTNAEDLIKVFELRSDVYQNINYQKEFPDLIDGLNLDIYDKNSAIIFYKNDQNISGTTRLILIQKINYHQIKSLVLIILENNITK